MDRTQRLCASLAAVVAALVACEAVAAEVGAIGKSPVERMIDLNRRAFTDLQQQHFQAARYWLTEALVISETAGLDKDEMTARTYVHMAVVYLTGMQDREQAVRQLRLALRINPNITLTPGLETPALKAAYLQAREELELPPDPDVTVEATPAPEVDPTTPPVAVPAEVAPPVSVGEDADPDLPARVPMPVYCTVPLEIPGRRDLLVRCLTQKQQKRASATLYHRGDDATAKFTAIPMGHSPKGWLVAVVPGSAIEGRLLAFYVKAQLPGSSTSIYYGYPEAPKSVLVTPPSPDGAAATPGSAAGPPVDTAGGGNRRRAAAGWLSLVGGLGTVYHGRESVDSGARLVGANVPLEVEAGFSAATLFQLEPEVGYQLTPRFALSLLARFQYAPMEGSFQPVAGQHAVRTSALAGFARGHFLLGSIGDLQTYVSGGAGAGTSFLAVVGERCDALCPLDHSDTLHGGFFGTTAGLSAVYRFSPRLGVLVDVKEIVTFPKVMALTELNLGLELVHDFAASRQHAESDDLIAWQ